MSNGYLEWFQTLADVTRVRLLSVLDQSEFSVGEICTIVQLPQSTVSRHLKLLSADGWIRNRREGTNQLYWLSRSDWSESRQQLWGWVMANQPDTATAAQDRARLMRVVAERSRSEAFFSSAADGWDRMRVDLFGGQLDAFALAATMPRSAVVAELGCGSAPLAQLVAPYVREVIAVDNSTAMLATARERLGGNHKIRLLHASLADLPIDDATCDVAWLVLVLPYIEDTYKVLLDSSRILKPDASLVVVDLLPHDRQSYRQEMGHVRMGISQTEIDQWFTRVGLCLSAYHCLPSDPIAKGPALFAAIGRKQN